MKKIFLICVAFVLMVSCYITPENETSRGSLSVQFPADAFPMKDPPAGTAYLDAYIVGDMEQDTYALFDNPDSVSEDDDFVFYNKGIALTPENDVPVGSGGTYALTLDNVPEGDDLYIFIFYFSSDYVDYGSGEYSGYKVLFISVDPISVRDNETTNVELQSFIM